MVSRRATEAVEGGKLETEMPERNEADGQDLSVLLAQHSQFHAGPLPPPDMLREYAEIIPDGANRIIEGWEGEVKHRRRMETRGQVMAAAIAALAIGASVVTAYLGQPLVASVIIAATMAGIGLTGALGIFLSRR